VNKRTFLIAALCGAVCLLRAPLAAAQATDETAAWLVVEFGPNEIWQPTREQVSALHECRLQLFTCVREVMDANGASPEAVAFFHLTGWFLGAISRPAEDTGPVQLGTIFNPWRANENEQLALLGGIPDVVYLEREGQSVSLDHNPDFQALRDANPNVMFWTSGATLEDLATSPQDGQRFVMRYRLLDGCHACAILGYAQVALDFAPDGTYLGTGLLRVVPRVNTMDEAE
jgi:hypothetical protein